MNLDDIEDNKKQSGGFESKVSRSLVWEKKFEAGEQEALKFRRWERSEKVFRVFSPRFFVKTEC